MLQKPDLPDEKIIRYLCDAYGLTVTELEFLPIGYDAQASVYRVTTDSRQPYFLKVRRDAICKACIQAVYYLKTHGVEEVVAPLPTLMGVLWGSIDPFTLILYPFIEGDVGMTVGLSDEQWIAFGDSLRRLHTIQLPVELLTQIHRENFAPKWSGIVRKLQAEIQQHTYDNLYEDEMAAFWRERQEQISQIVERTKTLGQMLQARSLDFVPCHADIHTANVLLSADGNLHIVDWDQLILAPKERDLMFVAGEMLFFQGYGKVDLNALGMAYYRYEWVVQELGDFGERVFLATESSDEIKQDSIRGFRALFDPGDVIEAAYKADRL